MKKPYKPTPLPMKPGMTTQMKPKPSMPITRDYQPLRDGPKGPPMNAKQDAIRRMRGNK